MSRNRFMVGTLMSEAEKASFDAAAKAEMTTVSNLSRLILTTWLRRHGYMERKKDGAVTIER